MLKIELIDKYKLKDNRESNISLNLEDYIDKKVAINCRTEKQAEELFEVLKSLNCVWSCDPKLDSVEWTTHECETCYRIGKENLISYASVGYYKDINYKIVNFEDLIIN